jgi:uncharacterized membrane protein YedE/YeeE
MKNEPLAWYIAGPLIGLIVPLLLLLKEKQFGISSSYRFLISGFTKKNDYFNYNREQDAWQFYFAIGLVLTGLFYNWNGYDLNALKTTKTNVVGFSGGDVMHYVSTSGFYDLSNWAIFLFGGVLIGFGSRYSNGCTAGHCIMGMSQFSLTSFIATIGFFIGGLIATYFIIPYLF